MKKSDIKIPLSIAGAICGGGSSLICLWVASKLLSGADAMGVVYFSHDTLSLFLYFFTILVCTMIGYFSGRSMERGLRKGSERCIRTGATAGLFIGFFTGTAIFPVLIEGIVRNEMGDIVFSLIAGTGPGMIIGSIAGAVFGSTLRKIYRSKGV
ncbi:MAG: hypothetical protein PHW04_06585 [Candidatus Wallbacteria bacterium]|nr:hypothetical protein [Candidatus Wallbacteria bacterium]